MASNDQNIFDKMKTNLAIANREKGNASAMTTTAAAKAKADAAAAAKAKADTLKAMAAFTAKQKADKAKTKSKASTSAPAKDPKGISKTWADINKSAADIGYGIRKNTASDGSVLNFLQTAGNYLMSGEDLPAGQGWGDMAREQYLADLAKRYPEQAAAEAAAKAAPSNISALIANAQNNTLTNWGNPVSNKAATGKPSTTVTPASIAAQMTTKVGAQRAAEMAAAKATGGTYTPGQAMGTAQNAYNAQQQAAQDQADADSLAKSNAAIESSYNPVLDFLKKQADKTNARYEQNAANLKSIFGALSGLSAVDTKRINDQFTSSITKQQSDLAARTAEQRASQAAGTAQLAETGAERGNSPALGGSPTATATEQGIGQANAIQQNWEGLMGAQQANAVTDITNRGEGYGQQQVAATNQMTQNLQDALSGIEGQMASTQSQIAQAKVARDQAIASNQYEAAAAAQKALDALELQGMKNKGITDVATIRVNGSLAAKRLSGGGSGSSAKVPASEAIKARADALGPTVFQQVQASAGDAYNQAFATLNPEAGAPGVKVKTPTAADVKAAWQAAHRGTATSVAPLANDYIDSAYK